MPSSNNLIQSLRSAHDPHFKLEGKVGGLEKGLGIEVAKLHKTLSKSFAMQRKTLARVLGLEGRVGILESQQAAEEQAQEGIDEILEEILGDKPKKKPAAKKKKRPAKPVGKKIPKKKPVAKKKKISAKDIKRGTSQETIGERIDRLEQNAQDSAAGEEHQKTTHYQETTSGRDAVTGENLSGAEQKRRFLLRKKGIKVEDIKKGTSVQGAENVAPNNEVTDLAKRQAAGDLPQGVTEPPAQDVQQSQLEGIKGPLKAIAESIDRIKDSLTGQSKVQEDAVEDARKSDEEKDAKKAESGLEKFLGPVKAAGEKILAPVKGIFGQIIDFFTTIFLGRIAFKLFEWFANPANTDKITSIFKFIADWWPVLLAGIMAFLPGLLGPAGLILGTIALLAWGVPKIINAVKSIFGFGKDIDKELKTGGDKLDSDISKAGKDAEKKLEPPKEDKNIPGEDPSKSSTPAELSGAQDSQQKVQNFNKGGEVQGSGDKDTVPAMLTPGEFVMSKGAVEQYGINTMEGMNAAAGGTNAPTIQKGGSKGMNMMIPRYSGGGKAGSFDKSHYGTEGYQIGQVNPPTLVVSQEKFEERIVTKNGEIVDDKSYEKFSEMTASIGVPDLMEHQGQLVGEINKVPGYENINIQDVINKNVNMPLDQYLPILMNSDAQKATFAKWDAAHQADLQLRGISDPSKGFSMGYNGGGLVQGFAGGGIVGRLKNAGAKVLGKAKAQISNLQKPRVDHIHPPADPMLDTSSAQVAQSSGDAASASMTPASDIPNFNAGMMRSQSKIRTLGVSV